MQQVGRYLRYTDRDVDGVATAACEPTRTSTVQRSSQDNVGHVGDNHGLPGSRREYLTAFQHVLAEAGYIEGRNVSIEFRWANDQPQRLPALAADLVRRQVTVIVAPGGPESALATKAATLPIVFGMAADPVEAGLAASLNRPGSNVTGLPSEENRVWSGYASQEVFIDPLVLRSCIKVSCLG